jgi:diguanylate cyclase (GGDEF)-like protein/PAS domain S-box-containing protein
LPVNELLIQSLYLFAGIMAYATVHHLTIGLNSPHDRVQMLFACMCLFAMPFAFFYARTLLSASVTEYAWALKWSIDSAVLILLIFPWFIGLYTGMLSRILLAGLSVMFIAVIAVNHMQPYSLQYDSIDSLRTLHLPWGEAVTRGVGSTGSWLYLGIPVIMAGFAYALYALGSVYRRDRRRTDLWIMLAVVLLLISAIEGILVRLSVFDFIEFGPLGLLGLVVVMSVALTAETQQRLRNSERRFRSLVEQAPFSIQVLSPDGYTRMVNSAWEKLWGVKLEGVTNYNMLGDSQLVDKGVMPYIKKGFAGETAEIPPVRYNPADNPMVSGPQRDRWVRAYIYPIKSKTGAIDDVILMHEDVTEHKLAEDALRESETRFRTVIEQSPVGISFSRDGYTTDVNPAFLQMFGYDDAAEVRDSPVIDRIAPQCRAEMEDRIRRRSRGEPVEVTYETIGLRKDNSQFPLFISAQRVTLSDGPMSSAFLIDFTERKHAEAELRIAATAFESQESLVITDAHSVILRVNKAFSESTGYTAGELAGLTPRIFKSGRHNEDFYREMWETISRTGTWQGEIWDKRKNGEVYPKWLSISAVKGNDGAITHYVGSHVDITERKASEEKIQHLAFYDHLTDLPNRLLLLDRLQQALVSSARSSRKGALLFIDLDNFKNLNDTLGHDMGDMLLLQVTQRLEACLREGDTLARLGGDEFMVMLIDLSANALEAAAVAEDVGEEMLDAFKQPYQLNNNAYRCTASIGVTLFGGKQQTADELMKQADIAMYQAKKAGRNALRFFDMQMQENISARVSLEGELQNALEFQQFHLYYQIQVDSSQHPLGAEALIRWIHPARGLVSPAQFIPLAEETGLILPIGHWVLETACAQLKAWQQDAITRDLSLAVNVSALQFRQADFVAQVKSVVKNFAIDPKLLKLELTESVLQENIEDTISIMNALNGIGIQFSLDDFGTGYSSLQYLKRLPLDQLKIDQSFVRDIGINSSDKAVVRAIIAMAKSIGVDVIAEGVETEEQQQFLVNNGCDHYQGLLFGMPVPIVQFEELLGKGS